MSTFRNNRRVVDDVREVKQIKKILPFTVTPIGGINELKAWKADQARKQGEWDAKAPERYQSARARALEVLEGKRAPTISAHTGETESQYIARRQVKSQITKAAIVQPKLSLLQRFGYWLLDQFLKINLN